MYCTIEQVRRRNSTLLSLAVVLDARVEEEILSACEVIDGAISMRYPAPLSPVPYLISSVAADLAASALLAQVTGNRGENAEPSQASELRERAMQILDDISSGRIALISVKRNAPAVSTTYDEEPVFEGWEIGDSM